MKIKCFALFNHNDVHPHVNMCKTDLARVLHTLIIVY